MSVVGKGYLVVGASSGIGRAAVEHLARGGATVLACSRRPCAGLPAGPGRGAVISVPLDVRDTEAVARLASRVAHELGPAGLHGVVYSAGLACPGPLELQPAALVEDVLRVNVGGFLHVARATLPLLRASRGRIVAISSPAAVLPLPGDGLYSASKAALEVLARILAEEARPCGVRVVILEPGATDTPMLSRAASDLRHLEEHPLHDRYAGLMDQVVNGLALLQRWAAPPEHAARTIEALLTQPAPPTLSALGADAHAQRLLALLPSWALRGVLRLFDSRGTRGRRRERLTQASPS